MIIASHARLKGPNAQFWSLKSCQLDPRVSKQLSILNSFTFLVKKRNLTLIKTIKR